MELGGKNWEKTVDRRKGLEIGNSTLTVDHIQRVTKSIDCALLYGR